MTKDDRFSMSAILKYRKTLEEEAAIEAASLKRRLEAEEVMLMEMENRKETAINLHRENKYHTVEEINITHSFLSTIDAEISHQKKKVSDMAKNYERTLEELISAAMDRKIMESMRDREWSDYKRMLWVMEQKTMDEIAVNSYCRSR